MNVYQVGDAVSIYFTTNDSNGARIAPSSAFESADVTLYKDGSATQRTSQSGWTMDSPFDSVVGLHRLGVDTSDNTDAGFYAAGSVYTPVLNPDTETISGYTVVSVLDRFRLGPEGVNLLQWLGTAAETPSVAGRPSVDMKAISNDTVAADNAESFFDGTGYAGTNNVIPTVTTVNNLAAGVITAAAIATNAIDADSLATDAVTEIVTAILTTQMTEAYAADGVAPTLAQAMFMLISGCLEFSITGTTLTCKKLDGSSVSMTYALNSSTAPTSRTRTA